MQTTRDIKDRIRGIKDIQQITRTMKLVSAAKLKKCEQRFELFKPHVTNIRRIMGNLLLDSRPYYHDLIGKRSNIKTACVLTITSDKGLCGPFNNNILRRGIAFIKEQEKSTIITIGKKGTVFFHRHGYDILDEHRDFYQNLDYQKVIGLGNELIQLYQEAQFDVLYLVYHKFKAPIAEAISVVKLLPLENEDFDEQNSVSPAREFSPEGYSESDTKPSSGSKSLPGTVSVEALSHGVNYLFEPPIEEILEWFIPVYINTMLFRYIAESECAEHLARMTAMENASNNASELIDSLTLMYNRARQAAITKEILDIVGGTEVLK